MFSESVQSRIAQFEFIVTPQSVRMAGVRSGRYELNLEKGAQVIQKFKEQIIIQSKQHNFRFVDLDKSTFKVRSQSNSSLNWSIYFVSQDKAQLIAHFPLIGLLNSYQQYIASYNRQCQSLNGLNVKQQNRAKIIKQWPILKKRIACTFSGLKSENESGSLQVRYTLQIRCELDRLCEMQNGPNSKSIMPSPNKKQLQLSSGSGLQKIQYQSPSLTQKRALTQTITDKLNQSIQFHQKEEQSNKWKTKGQPSALSDIVQTSNQCSSNPNYGERCNKLKQIDGITEEENQLSSPLIARKTHNFLSNSGDDSPKRRSFTLTSRQSDHQESEYKKLTTYIDAKDNHLDIQLQKEELSNAQYYSKLKSKSKIKTDRRLAKPKVSVIKKAQNFKMVEILVVFIVILVFFCLAVDVFKADPFKQKLKHRSNWQRASKRKKLFIFA